MARRARSDSKAVVTTPRFPFEPRANEIRVGEKPRREPWRHPLERATEPPVFVPNDAAYRAWLFTTLADLAEHFTRALQWAPAIDEDGGALRETARILRATAFALARRDRAWLEKAGDLARRALAKESSSIRVPALAYFAEDRLSWAPGPYLLAGADIVLRRPQLAEGLKRAVYSFLVTRQNVNVDAELLRSAARELAELFSLVLRGCDELAAKCERRDDLSALEASFTKALAAAERSRLSAPPDVRSSEDRVRHVENEIQKLQDFAEKLVLAGLRALGYPRAGLRTLFSFVDKRAKKGAPPPQLTWPAPLEPPWPMPADAPEAPARSTPITPKTARTASKAPRRTAKGASKGAPRRPEGTPRSSRKHPG